VGKTVPALSVSEKVGCARILKPVVLTDGSIAQEISQSTVFFKKRTEIEV
jgi:hypothetical protein